MSEFPAISRVWTLGDPWTGNQSRSCEGAVQVQRKSEGFFHTTFEAPSVDSAKISGRSGSGTRASSFTPISSPAIREQ